MRVFRNEGIWKQCYLREARVDERMKLQYCISFLLLAVGCDNVGIPGVDSTYE